MKKLFILLVGSVLIFSQCSESEESTENQDNDNTEESTTDSSATETTESSDGAAMKFEETSFDFGEIVDGDVVEHEFAFTNDGSAPLVINKAKTPCGCTAPDYPKEEIAPGASNKITIRFNSAGKAYSGAKQIDKTVLVLTNAREEPYELNIKAFVQPSK